MSWAFVQWGLGSVSASTRHLQNTTGGRQYLSLQNGRGFCDARVHPSCPLAGKRIVDIRRGMTERLRAKLPTEKRDQVASFRNPALVILLDCQMTHSEIKGTINQYYQKLCIFLDIHHVVFLWARVTARNASSVTFEPRWPKLEIISVIFLFYIMERLLFLAALPLLGAEQWKRKQSTGTLRTCILLTLLSIRLWVSGAGRWAPMCASFPVDTLLCFAFGVLWWRNKKQRVNQQTSADLPQGLASSPGSLTSTLQRAGNTIRALTGATTWTDT